MREPDPDYLARRALRQHRAVASGLLALMAVLALVSYALPLNWWTG